MIVVARGGGSVEDLLPFSDEALVRAVPPARTPVVSAIGHEPDSPLLDLVADVRASTPTDAAKLVVPDVAEELRGVVGPATGCAPRVGGWLDREQAGARRAPRPGRRCADPRSLLDARADEVDRAARPRPAHASATASTAPPTTSATSAPAPARCRRSRRCSAATPCSRTPTATWSPRVGRRRRRRRGRVRVADGRVHATTTGSSTSTPHRARRHRGDPMS